MHIFMHLRKETQSKKRIFKLTRAQTANKYKQQYIYVYIPFMVVFVMKSCQDGNLNGRGG